jgi:hypothetical protein
MYHTQKNPLKKVTRDSETVETVRASRMRKLHKAFLRYHDAENWPLLREALKQMGRADLIGNGKKHLIPSFQPAGTGLRFAAGHHPRPVAGRPVGKPSPRPAQSPKPARKR